MANHRIWAPWRLAYVKDASKDIEEDCIFCAKAAEDDDEANLIVHRGERCFVILNLYPYTNGHLMIAPYEHIGRLQDLAAEAMAEMMGLAQRAMGRLEEVYDPHGYNVGLNQGRVAGAGVEHHIHLHVVPRWGGDTNFMPVIADTKVMPQTLEQSYAGAEGRSFERADTACAGRRSSRPTTSAVSTARRWTRAPPMRSDAPLPESLRGCAASRPRELRVGLGRDMRLTAPAMAAELRDGLIFEGATVLDAGMVATEMLYHLVGSRQLDGGAMVTASHNPKAYTGVKLVREGALALSGDAGIGEVRKEIESGLGERPAAARWRRSTSGTSSGPTRSPSSIAKRSGR